MKENVKSYFKKVFCTKHLAQMGILTALSFALYMLKFNLPFMFPSFLEMQFSELPALIGGLMMGPIEGSIIILARTLIKLPLSSTACVGELADFLLGIAYVLPASLIYTRNKTKKNALIGIIVGFSLYLVVAMAINRFVLIPFYTEFFFNGNFQILVNILKGLFKGVNKDNFYYYYIFLSVLPFNFLRGLLVAVITFLAYKKISIIFKNIFNEKKSKNFTKCVKEGNIIISESEKETIEIAKEYAKTLKSGDVLRLDGDLGAGKTAFVKGIALGLNIDSEVVSPTYAYLNDYEGKLFHFDMYRIPDEEYAENLGLFEYFYGNGICVVEWAERVENHLPEKVKKIEIKNLGGNNREIKL